MVAVAVLLLSLSAPAPAPAAVVVAAQLLVVIAGCSHDSRTNVSSHVQCLEWTVLKNAELDMCLKCLTFS